MNSNLSLPVGGVFPGVMVHSNGLVYLRFQDTNDQTRVQKRTRDLDPGPAPNDVVVNIPDPGYHLIDVNGFLYFAGGDAIYKVHPDTLNVVGLTNQISDTLNFLNILYDGRLIAADARANLYVFERDFDINLAHKSPIASYTAIDELNVNTIAVDNLNKIYVITRQNVWAIQ